MLPAALLFAVALAGMLMFLSGCASSVDAWTPRQWNEFYVGYALQARVRV